MIKNKKIKAYCMKCHAVVDPKQHTACGPGSNIIERRDIRNGDKYFHCYKCWDKDPLEVHK